MASLTITDIAKIAGVSKSTVSRVLNGSVNVNPETRQKVNSVIHEVGYSPSKVARFLSTQITDTIGVILPEIDNPFFGNFLRGIIEVIDSYGLTMICCNTDDKFEKDVEALTLMRDQRVRGFIYTAAVDYNRQDQNISYLKKLLDAVDAPFVQADRLVSGIESDCISFDDTTAIYQATEALILKGHKKIAILNAGLEQYLAQIRQQAFLKAMADYHIPVEARYIFLGDYHQKSAYKLSKEMLSMEDGPTAVISCNNNNTLGFLRALYEKGGTLSGGIDCISLDCIEALDIIHIPLNYIRRDSYIMGKKAMETLIARLTFPERPKQNILLKAPLIISRL